MRDPSVKFVLIGHNISGNSTGRLLAMAEVATSIGETQVFSFGRNQIWPGASQFAHQIVRLGSNWRSILDSALESKDPAVTVLWICKGLSPLDRVARYVSSTNPSVVIILDIDDDDRSLAKEFVATSLSNAVRLNPFRRGNAIRIESAQENIRSDAHGFTFSTHALAESNYKSYRPYIRVPHVRPDSETSSKVVETKSRKRFGYFGTIRPHKGGRVILEFMRSNRDWTLVTFENCGLGEKEPNDSNWVEIPTNTPLNIAYEQIDVTLLPITNKNSGAQLQLPAKLIDALKFGTPVVASATPAIREIAGSCFIPLPDDATNSTIRDLLTQAVNSHDETISKNIFENSLSKNALSVIIDEFILRFNLKK